MKKFVYGLISLLLCMSISASADSNRVPPDNIKKEIRQKCAADFPSDFSKQASCIKEQLDGWLAINDFTKDEVSLKPSGKKISTQPDTQPQTIVESKHKKLQTATTQPALTQTVQQAGPKNHVAVFPSAFNFDAKDFQGRLESGIPTFMENILEDIARFKEFQLTNLLKDRHLQDICWNKYKPNVNGIINQAKQQGIDFVLLYYFNFGEGQGLVNGWGIDFHNPTFKVFLVDVQNKTVFEKKDSDTVNLDQLSIELKGMSRQLLLKTEFPN